MSREIDIDKGPTADECGANASVVVGGRAGFAIWYPQMGGYGALAVVFIVPGDGGDACFDALVWHDGEFPFSEGRPAELHHCKPEQFVRFGETVKKLIPETAHGPMEEQR